MIGGKFHIKLRNVESRLRSASTRYGILVAFLLIVIGCASSSEEKPRKMDPKAAALLGQAQQAFRQGAYVQTVALADSAAAYVPDRPDPWFLRGRALGEMYRFDESDAAFEQALKLDPDYRSAHYHMGHNAFLQSSNSARDGYREALRHYMREASLLREALEDEDAPKEDHGALATVLLQVGTTYHNIQRPDSAKLAYREALRIDSTLAKGYAWLAGVQHSEGELEEALTNARRAAALAPENAEYTLLIGVLLNGLERYDEAVPYLTEAAQKIPWNRTAVYTLGNALVAAGEHQEGTRYLARADSMELLRAQIEQAHMGIFHEPGNPIRWENYAFLLYQAGQMEEAKRAIGVMRNLPPIDSTSVTAASP